MKYSTIFVVNPIDICESDDPVISILPVYVLLIVVIVNCDMSLRMLTRYLAYNVVILTCI